MIMLTNRYSIYPYIFAELYIKKGDGWCGRRGGGGGGVGGGKKGLMILVIITHTFKSYYTVCL